MESCSRSRREFLNFGFFCRYAIPVSIAVVTLSPAGPAWADVLIGLRGQCSTSGNPNDVVKSGAYAYVATSWGLEVINVLDPNTPYRVGGCATGSTRAVAVNGSYAYVIRSDRDLAVINISNPSTPVQTGTCSVGGDASYVKAMAIAVSGGYAYITGYHLLLDPYSGATLSRGWLYIVSVANPALPAVAGSTIPDSWDYSGRPVGFGVAVSGSYAYMADDWHGMHVILVSSPSAPYKVATYPGGGQCIALSGYYSYIGAASSSGVEIVNISNPTAPSYAGSCLLPSSGVTGIVVSGPLAYTVGGSGFNLFDITNPAVPILEGGYSGVSSNSRVAVAGSYAYVSTIPGLKVFSVGGCTQPGLTITPTGCPTSAVIAGAMVSGSATGNWWNSSTYPNSLLRLVVGWRDPTSGNSVGTPVDLGLSANPSECLPGTSFGSPNWNINAPATAGTYHLWAYVSEATTASAAVQDFQNHVRTSDVDREKKLCPSVQVLPPCEAGIQIESSQNCPGGSVAPAAPLFGYASGRWWRSSVAPSPSLRLVYGWRRQDGYGFGLPQPRILGSRGAPSICPPGDSFSQQRWIISAPNDPGIYDLWLYVSTAPSDDGAIAEFRNRRVTTESHCDRRICGGVVVEPLLDLTVAKVELSQAIDVANNPLIAHRATFVRVYVNWTGVQQGAVHGVDARLRVYANGAELPESPITSEGAITAVQLPNALNEHDTINFVIHDPPISTDVHLQVELNPEHRVPEANYANNIFDLVGLGFQCRRGLDIGYVPVAWTPTGLPGDPPPVLPPPEEMSHADGLIRATYPIPVTADLSYSYHEVSPALAISGPLTNDAAHASFLLRLSFLYNEIVPPPDILFAWLPEDAPMNVAGKSIEGGHVAFGSIADFPDMVIAHEIGHSLWMCHALGPGCPDDLCDVRPGAERGQYHLDAIGVDVEHHYPPWARIWEPNSPALMTCRANAAWIDPTMFRHIAAEDRTQCPPVPLSDEHFGTTPSKLVGIIRDTAAQTTQIVDIVAANDEQLSIEDPAGGFSLQAFHADGDMKTLLYEHTFSFSTGDGLQETVGIATLVVPAIGSGATSVDEIDIVDRGSNTTVAQRIRTNSAPSIVINSPLSGETLTDGQAVTWMGTDSDGDALLYSLLYTWNEGQSWLPLLVNAAATSYKLDFAVVPGSNQGTAKVKVIANDGFNTNASEVGGLTVTANKAPSIHIVVPAGGAVFLGGTSVLCDVAVNDAEDANIPGTAIVWTSNLDGVLGHGESLLVADLSLGTHVVTVEATDSGGMVSSDSVTIQSVPRPSGVVPGDLNFDGQIDGQDVSIFEACFTGTGETVSAGCQVADLNADGHCDCADWVMFVGLWPGSDVPTFIPCAAGNFDHDYDIDGDDYGVIRGAIGHCVGQTEYRADADLDHDGCVTLVDYQLWIQTYRQFVGNQFAPPPLAGQKGDMNGDGAVSASDISGFVSVLLDGNTGSSFAAAADMNGDGVVDGLDIQAFVDVLIGP